ncbi:FAD-dependent oxidoreductase [Sporomusa acidovorans]|uniref:MnmG N-terminal domain-containing protein n=1 Tax=Sporomusa acidovorans (strain ATCC 49682 / DSM 3132 / Mol) TaxID=1123286 RepID=A0ABZ3J3Z7_SPOA4|nr:FAD-dependent oxidoreductase [Sporomusa acidovorans]OZC20291.1 methylenetetrahydrofolate--tRNA-(uracil-5-)-methyltransferase TrmFO [Sporomusa acidovorans DSM 3132]SDD39055.1 Glucose inhibited division protein A [Sporomusa acidovorans]
MARVVVIGGGWAGCSAAVSAKKAGAAEVILLERADMLLGTGLVGGIMRNNGRFTATEEAVAMGGGDIFAAVDQVARHKNIEFPGHKHVTLYDVAHVEPAIRKVLERFSVQYNLMARVRDITMEGQKIKSVITDQDDEVYGDVFIEATGTAGPQGQCSKYGNGCVMCIIRCPSFGPRISIAARAGVQEMIGKKADGSLGAMSGSCKLHKESLSKAIVTELNSKGVAVIPIPEELKKAESLSIKACQQYALKEFADNIILLDTGHAKLMSPFYPLDKLRKIPGFENARYEDPYAGGVGNSMRFTALSPRDNALKVQGVDNLFCGGEKAGLLVGHTEAIVTGTLAGHNAVRSTLGKEMLVLPEALAIGDAIAHVREQMQTEEGLKLKYTFSGAQYFKRMQEKGLYTTDVQAIKDRVEKAGLTGVFSRPV